MISTSIATVAAGLFAGAAVYVSTVEHPARVQSGPALAIKEFGPSYRRGAFMQIALAVTGPMAAVLAWYQGAGIGWLTFGLLLASLIPYTLVAIKPTNNRLLDPKLDSASAEARELLSRWGRLHAVRTVVGAAVFLAFVWMSQ